MAPEENFKKAGLTEMFRAVSEIKGIKSAGVIFVLLFLAVGGFVSWMTMGDAAHRLVAGEGYTQLSSNSALYEGASRARKDDGFFASEEELAKADPSLKKELMETLTASDAKGADTAGGVRAAAASAAVSGANSGGGAFGGSGINDAGYGGSGGGGTPSSGFTMARKLSIKGASLSGLNQGGQGGSMTSIRTEESGRASAQIVRSDGAKPAGGAAKGPKTSVMDSLKGAFKATLYGSRLASQDSARGWIAKTFEATPDETRAIEYDSRVKAKLDAVNPASVPQFLRDQDLDSTSARSLKVAEVGAPSYDRQATDAARKQEPGYEVMAMEGMLNPVFSGLGTGLSRSVEGDTRSGDPAVLSDPEDTQMPPEVRDYNAGDPYGTQCGCSQNNPCTCLPPGFFDAPASGTTNCDPAPMGPYQPGKPACGGMVGDFDFSSYYSAYA